MKTIRTWRVIGTGENGIGILTSEKIARSVANNAERAIPFVFG
jgi:hypothetical protein